VEGGDSCGISMSLETPTAKRGLDVEAQAMPAESVRLERKATATCIEVVKKTLFSYTG